MQFFYFAFYLIVMEQINPVKKLLPENHVVKFKTIKLAEKRLIKEPDKSFIVYHETTPFSSWHFHPEYELVYIVKGKGKRMIGDHIDRFKENDLVFLGPNLPHEWSCNEHSYNADGNFIGEAIVIQFLHDFLGDQFMSIPENYQLANFLKASTQGCKIFGQTKAKIISCIKSMVAMNKTERLYTLFKIFYTLSESKEYQLLASPGFIEPFNNHDEEPITMAWQYILKNYQHDIKIKDLLEITCMSSTAFCSSFKKYYKMNFKEYLLNLRIGYACRLLQERSVSIAEIAYESGFQNLSNFNRQFKRIKGITPKNFKYEISLFSPEQQTHSQLFLRTSHTYVKH
jgi:AraC-like DNA-binding protein